VAKPTPTLAPTPTVATPNRADITIEVLNGGGVPGAAGKMKTFLEDKGYKVGSTANADAYTFDETEIDVKPGKEAYLKLLQADLASDYTVGTSTATLDRRRQGHCRKEIIQADFC
jgi:hypothetical protein